MIFRRKKCLLIFLVLVLASTSIYAVQANLERLFNSGLNYGWLRQSFEYNMFRNMWNRYAQGGAAEYNNAFSPPRRYRTPSATLRGAQQAIGYIPTQIRSIRGASQIFKGGVALARAHIFAQNGRCPSCLKGTMFTAGNHIEAAGRDTNNRALMNIGRNLMNQSRAMRGIMNMQQVQAYTGTLAGFMQQVQGAI